MSHSREWKVCLHSFGESLILFQSLVWLIWYSFSLLPTEGWVGGCVYLWSLASRSTYCSGWSIPGDTTLHEWTPSTRLVITVSKNASLQSLLESSIVSNASGVHHLSALEECLVYTRCYK